MAPPLPVSVGAPPKSEMAVLACKCNRASVRGCGKLSTEVLMYQYSDSSITWPRRFETEDVGNGTMPAWLIDQYKAEAVKHHKA